MESTSKGAGLNGFRISFDCEICWKQFYWFCVKKSRCFDSDLQIKFYFIIIFFLEGIHLSDKRRKECKHFFFLKRLENKDLFPKLWHFDRRFPGLARLSFSYKSNIPEDSIIQVNCSDSLRPQIWRNIVF